MSHKKIIGSRLLKGEQLVDLVNEYPELMFGYKKLKQDIECYRLDIHEGYVGPRDCHWYVGPSGAGKSRKAFEEVNPFVKPLNKWWDGY